MAGADSGNDHSLEQTPTWPIAVVCLAFVAMSLLLEHGIHYASNVRFCLDFNCALFGLVELILLRFSSAFSLF